MTIKVLLSKSSNHIITLFERFAIEVLRASKIQTAQLLKVPLDTLHHKMTKAVKHELSHREDDDIIDEKRP